MADKQTGRNPVITLSRILGMVFIVLCHIIKYYSFIPMHESLGQFFNCGVDLFIFISGYLYGGKVINNFGRWYWKRIVTVAVPAVILSIVVIIALSIAGQYQSINSILAYCLDLEGLLFLNWNLVSMIFKEIPSLGPLWFTTIIMLCYLMVPLFQKISTKIKNKTRFLIIILVCGSVISIVASNYISLFYFVVFALGYFSKQANLLERVNITFFALYSLIFIGSIVFRIILQRTIEGSFAYQSYVTVSHFFLGTWFIVSFAFLYNLKPNAIIDIANGTITKTLDKYSFFVYLTHGVFCMGYFNLYESISLPISTVLFLISTVLSAILIKFISTKLQYVILMKAE